VGLLVGWVVGLGVGKLVGTENVGWLVGEGVLVGADNKSIRSRFGPPSLVDAVILITLFPGKHVVST